MRKLKKILFIILICIALIFILQKFANFYIERQINAHLTPYNITANLEQLNKLTLNYKGISLACKIKIEGKFLTLVPIDSGIVSKLLPDTIRISLN